MWILLGFLFFFSGDGPRRKYRGTNKVLEERKQMNLVKNWPEDRVPSCVALLRDGMIVSRAVDERAGQERGDVGDDRHQGAAHGALVRGAHGDDDIVLVPHVEGVLVGVIDGRRQMQRTTSVLPAAFGQILIYWAQQTICGSMRMQQFIPKSLVLQRSSRSPFNLVLTTHTNPTYVSLLFFCITSTGNYVVCILVFGCEPSALLINWTILKIHIRFWHNNTKQKWPDVDVNAASFSFINAYLPHSLLLRFVVIYERLTTQRLN